MKRRALTLTPGPGSSRSSWLRDPGHPRRTVPLASLAAGLMLAACSGPAPRLSVEDARYRPPLTAGGLGVAYFSVTAAADDTLIGLSSPQAERVEMHASLSRDGLSVMEKRDRVELPAGKRVDFRPGGLHLMVISPQPVDEAATISIQMTLKSGYSQSVPFAVTRGPDRTDASR